MAEPFIQFCETLWRKWIDGALDVPPFVMQQFRLDAAPEPYLQFGRGSNYLVALTTNPGGVMRHQLLATVKAGTGPLNTKMDYATAAVRLADFYDKNLDAPAERRIHGLLKLAALAGYDGVLQVEACPFHSTALPKKAALLQTLADGGLLAGYTASLKAYIRPLPVVVLSAVSSKESLRKCMTLSPWIVHLTSLAGLTPGQADFRALTRRGWKTTSAALLSREAGTPKGLLLMMGGNHLPSEDRLSELAAAFKRRD